MDHHRTIRSTAGVRRPGHPASTGSHAPVWSTKEEAMKKGQIVIAIALIASVCGVVMVAQQQTTRARALTAEDYIQIQQLVALRTCDRHVLE
jgi:hypothetical protein